MIVLFIELLIILILAMIFSMLILDQRRNHAREMRIIKLKGYWNGSERRSVNRLNVALKVKYATNGVVNNAESLDISTKGVRLLLDERIEKGTPLRLEIKIPDQDRLVKARGEVVWAGDSTTDESNPAKRLFNTGIKFSKVQNANEKRLFDFIYGLEPQKS